MCVCVRFVSFDIQAKPRATGLLNALYWVVPRYHAKIQISNISLKFLEVVLPSNKI